MISILCAAACRRRELVGTCTRRMRHRRLAEAFADWHDEARAIRALGGLGRQALARIASGRLASLFWHWKVCHRPPRH